MNPYDGDCDNDKQIRSFQQEHIPQPKMGPVRNRIRKKRDVSLLCVDDVETTCLSKAVYALASFP
jgi:hypothetical protein